SEVASKLVFTPLSSVKFKIILSPALALNTSSLLTLPLTTYLPPQVTQNVKWSGSLNTNATTEVVKVDLDPAKFNVQKTEDG
ncbi:hypothetical protein VWO06_10050, partial [Campylobacter coli]